MHYGAGTIMPKSAPADPVFGRSPRTLGGTSQCVFVAVEVPGAHYERAKAAGADSVMEPTDTDFGARNLRGSRSGGPCLGLRHLLAP